MLLAARLLGYPRVFKHACVFCAPMGTSAGRRNVAYLIFFLQGLGVLFPWNAFITVNNYFDKKLVGSNFTVR